MGSFSDYLEGAILQHVFTTGLTGSALAVPDKFVALCTKTVYDTSTGAQLIEPSAASGYTRIQNETWDDPAGAGATENTGAITFAQASASWGTILDFAIVDALTTGNLLAYGALTISKSVASGDTPKFATGDIDITLA
ncbi:hypothetical protein LCGC14_2829050 [marine sediment metagenome]|uniref:Uncharacterized protein n=1 Tax=marine sediment metagenome TaxID=412755 RepID=A0A0F8YEN8_9ZZZZ